MIGTIVFWLFWLTGVSQGMILPQAEGIKFIHINQVYASYSNWVLNFHFDLSDYAQQINNIEINVQKVKRSLALLALSPQHVRVGRMPKVIHNIFKKHFYEQEQDFYNELSRVHGSLDKLLSHKLVQSSSTLSQLESTFTGFYKLVTKPKRNVNLTSPGRQSRSLLPLGGFFSSLFGTASEDDVYRLQNHISVLKRSQQQIIHVLRESLSILMITNQNVQTNRLAINKLINSTHVLNDKVLIIMDSITRGLQPEIGYFELMLLYSSAFETLDMSIQNLYNAILELQNSVLSSLSGHLSMSLVPTDILYNALLTIQSKLSPDLELPYPLVLSNMHKFYKYVEVTLLPDIDSFNLILSLSLIKKSNLYDLYRIVTLPLFTNDSQHTVSINVESDFLAISQDRNTYLALDKFDINVCSQRTMSYCKFQKSSYSTTTAPSCISSLFLRNTPNIVKYCTNTQHEIPTHPIVKYLTEGHWYVFSPFDFDLDINCLNRHGNSPSISIIKGENLVILNSSCSANSPYFGLPYTLQQKLGLNIRKPPADRLNITHFLINKLETDFVTRLNLRKQNQIDQPNLPSVKYPNIDILNHDLDVINDSDNFADYFPTSTNLSWWAYCLIILTIVFLIIILIIIFRKVYSKHKYTLAKRRDDILSQIVHSARSIEETPIPIAELAPPSTKRRRSSTADSSEDIEQLPKRSRTLSIDDNDASLPGPTFRLLPPVVHVPTSSKQII